MINYIEKGVGLHAAIEAAGHKIYHENGTAISSNDVAVQAIIDSYNPLPYEKMEARKRVIEQINRESDGLDSSYPVAEMRTFMVQRAEAEAYSLDNSAPTPMLSAIAIRRGITLAEQVTKVNAKLSIHDNIVNVLVGKRQKLNDQIKNETDFVVVQSINFEA